MTIAQTSADPFRFLDGSLVITRDEIMARARPAPADCVLVSGTLVERIGNRHSDIDVYVFGDHLPDGARMGEHNYAAFEQGQMRTYYDYIDQQGFGFDVEYFTWDELAAILDEVNALYALAREKTKILRRKMHVTHYDLLHKLAVGQALCGVDELARRIGAETFARLAFVLYRSRTGGYPEFKDILGFWSAGDTESCLLNLETYLKEQAGGLCHLAGSTNNKPKWLFASLRRLPEADLARDILHWCQADRSDEARRRAQILAGCDLIDRINAAAVRLLNDGPAACFSAAEALELTEAEFQRETFHDRQTLLEFEHRRMLFGQAQRPLRQFLQEAA